MGKRRRSSTGRGKVPRENLDPVAKANVAARTGIGDLRSAALVALEDQGLPANARGVAEAVGVGQEHATDPARSARKALAGEEPVDVDATVYDPNRGKVVDLDDDPTRRRTLFPDGVDERHGSLGSAPPVRTAADVARLRPWMVDQLRPGRPYATVGALSPSGRHGGYGGSPMADSERAFLQRASLWWVAEPMVDLLATVAPSTPPDVRYADLPCPSDSGLVVLAKPLDGLDAVAGNPQVEVQALVWGFHVPAGLRRRCLSITSWRLLDFDAGLSGPDLKLGAVTGALAYGSRGPVEETVMPDLQRRATFSLHGTAWLPLGRSEWAEGDRLDEASIPFETAAGLASAVEDRQRLAALWTLLEQRGVASRTTEPVPRPVRRKAERSGVTAPSDVVVVTLRNPRREPAPKDGDAEPAKRSHRWFVREHLRWQPCGPGRQDRRLVLVRAHIKGPADAPLITKERVNAWVR